MQHKSFCQKCIEITLPNARFAEHIAANKTGIDQEVAPVVTIFTSAQLKKWIGIYWKQRPLKNFLFTCLCFSAFRSDLNNYSFHFQHKTFFVQLYMFRKLLCERNSDVYLDYRKTKSLQAVSIRQIPINIGSISIIKWI